MDKYVAIECRLAEALGYKSICVKMSGEYRTLSTIVEGKFIDLPKWARDNAAAFELIVDYEVFLDYCGDEVFAWANGNRLSKKSCKYKNSKDKQAAVRYAIVEAVIAKLGAK